VWEKVKPTLKAINAFLTVPMWAALISIFIAMIQPLQEGLSKVEPFVKAVKGAGQCSSEHLFFPASVTGRLCSVPVTLVVLGAFFYTPPDPAQAISLPPDNGDPTPKKGFFERKFAAFTKAKDANATTAYPGENKAVFVAVVSRMIVVPAILLPAVALLARYDPFEVTEDPVFILAAVLLISSVRLLAADCQ
jgi:hypothetical protein